MERPLTSLAIKMAHLVKEGPKISTEIMQDLGCSNGAPASVARRYPKIFVMNNVKKMAPNGRMANQLEIKLKNGVKLPPLPTEPPENLIIRKDAIPELRGLRNNLQRALNAVDALTPLMIPKRNRKAIQSLIKLNVLSRLGKA